MNQYDSAVMRSILDMNEHEEADIIENADIVLINGCSVREHAKKRALGFISSKRVLLKEKARIYLTGCLANSLNEIPKFVNGLIGPVNYASLNEIISSEEFIDARNREETGDYSGYSLKGSALLYVAVMKGCNNLCSYCIVPYLRGREVSFPPEAIIKQIEKSTGENIGEIMLLGQNVNSYNFKGRGFPELLKDIAGHFKNRRISFLTSHPKDLSDELVNVIASHANILRWVHLPVQSGSDRILKMMHRGYTVDQFSDRLNMLRKSIENIAVTTDIMVGFPYETDEDFALTMKLVEETGFDDAFMYKYSPRPYTLATFYEQPDSKIALERLKHLIEVQNSIKINKINALKGKTLNVMIEKENKRHAGQFIGRDDRNTHVIVNGSAVIGHCYKVAVSEIKGVSPVGTVKEEICT